MSLAGRDVHRASESLVRAHAAALTDLAAEFGVTVLRFASDGRLVGHLADDRDALDMAAFSAAAAELIGAELTLFSDAVVGKANVSADLVAAQPLRPGRSDPSAGSCSKPMLCSADWSC